MIYLKRFLWILSFLCVIEAAYAFGGRYESLEPQSIPEFTFMDSEGVVVTLDHYKGKVVVLNFWSVTCGPCIAEMPSLDQLAGYYPEDQLVVLTVNVDPLRKAGIQSFYDENRYRYLKIYQDPTRSSQEALKWHGLPATFIINKEGKLIGREFGYEKWDSSEALEFFDQLIQGKNPKIEPSFLQKMKSWLGI
jgi:thiol-disulfide isomerase/thioredoxin